MKIDEIRIGMKASYTQTITDADIKAFAGISGDRNPAHLDEEYAKNSRYKRRISHGLLCASFFSAIFGTKLPAVAKTDFTNPSSSGKNMSKIIKDMSDGLSKNITDMEQPVVLKKVIKELFAAEIEDKAFEKK